MINREYLRECSNRWEGSVVDGRSDISPSDAKVIDLLIDFFTEKSVYTLVDLLSDWKKIGDKEFVQKVIDFTCNENSTSSKTPLPVTTYIEFNDTTFPITYIKIISRGEEFCTSRNRSIFFIEINPRNIIEDPTVSMKQSWVLEEMRDEKYEELKDKLMLNGVQFI